jgi:quinol monooxygenase YgiN
MKPIKNLTASILLISTLVFASCSQPSNTTNGNSVQKNVVLLKFKSQPNKGALAVEELIKLIDKVKDEPNFISIKLHVDPEDETNILLYEEWEDLSYYKNEHMNTVHLKNFMSSSMEFLTGPPEVTFWVSKKYFD